MRLDGWVEPPSEAVIRRRRAGDADDIAVVHTLGWQRGLVEILSSDYLDGLSLGEARRRWRAKEQDADPPTDDVVAEIDGHVVGFASYGRSYDPDVPYDGSAEIGELYLLYVHPDHWRAGLGHRLHERALEALSEQGFRSATVWMVVGNQRAHRFYLRHGWVFDRLERTQTDRGLTWLEQRYRHDLPSQGA